MSGNAFKVGWNLISHCSLLSDVAAPLVSAFTTLHIHLSELLCSQHSLVGVCPFNSLREDASICGGVLNIGGCLIELVRGLELPGVVGRTVADHNLRGILVGHHNGGFR